MRHEPPRHATHVRDFTSKLAMLALGAALIIFATWFSSYVAFEPIVISGEEWSFGPREVAHLFGFMGCVLALWFFGNSFAAWPTMIVTLLIGAIGIGLVVFYGIAPRGIKNMIDPNAAETFLYVLYYYLLGCFSGCCIRKQSHWLLQPRRMLIIAALVLAATSMGWEVYTQPFEHVYHKAPRHYVQLAQVLCDFVGIAVGFKLVNSLIQKLESHGSANAAIQDCANTSAFAKELWAMVAMKTTRLRHLFEGCRASPPH